MRPKAEAWNVLDRGLAAQRAQQLSEQLAHVLLYGRTTSGPLANLDTNEVLPPSDATVALFIFTLTREEPGLRTFMQSKEAVLQALIELYSPKSIRRPHRDDAYVKNLQNRIYEQLEKRIHHVRRWIAINVAQFSPRNPDVRNLFAKLDTMALAMKAAGHICSAQCSRCELLCLLGYGHLNGEHDCGNKHPNSASTVNFIGMAGQTRESDKPTFPRCSPLDSIGSLNCLSITNISKALITEYTAQRIRVQDLDSMLLELPNKDAANALSIEWQSPCYLPYDSLVLRVDETYWSVHQKTWWIRLVREPGQDFITPHFTPYSVQRPSSAVRAEMKFWYGFSFGHVLQVLYILRDVMQKSCFGMGRETECWFYAAVLFEMLGTEVPNKVVSTVWAEGKRWTYQDHPSVNPVHHKQYRRIRDRVQRLLNPESSFAKQ
ncbi:hypothetical protein FRC12_016601 [Ceratobasidium sp. 428]|nr:hypothetical protein FRC12_016601 [Ceratobasidium sp. 428]